LRLDHLLDQLAQAPCTEVSVEVFYPEGRGRRDVYAEARAICAGCPVTDVCWQYLAAIEPVVPGPVWGFAAGYEPQERSRLYQQQAA
jgi:hypothetical protein